MELLIIHKKFRLGRKGITNSSLSREARFGAGYLR